MGTDPARGPALGGVFGERGHLEGAGLGAREGT